MRRRLVDDRKLVASILLGIIVAITLMAGAPVYVRALERLGVNKAIERASDTSLDIEILVPVLPLESQRLRDINASLDAAVERHIDSIFRGRQQYLRTGTYFVGRPGQPLPQLDSEGEASEPVKVSRGYLQSLSELDRHVTVLEGRRADDTVTSSSQGPFISVDGDSLKSWSISESRDRLKDFERELGTFIPASEVRTGIKALVNDFENRSFLSSITLILLFVVMAVTLLYFLTMMVSYLVQSRETDVALLRSRGVSGFQLLQIYGLEGLILVVPAVILAPFIAIGTVALAGMLPYFRTVTGGSTLPVALGFTPFLVAGAGGLLCLLIFVVPGVMGGRAGLIVHRLRSSRPPLVPLFQRYYLDAGLLVIGGLVFWELQARGEIVSEGLLRESQVNEALLLAPVLLLVVVALVFMRVFPLVVRFVSGESALLLHLLTAATLAVLAPTIIGLEVRDDNDLAWLGPVAMLAALALVYAGTSRLTGPGTRALGLVLQASLIAGFLVVEPPSADEAMFVPKLVLIGLVPAQVLFFVFEVAARVAPVWVSVVLWHMARNPLQYSWLVLLLVLVTGLGVLSTTVGGTLDRSEEEQVLYNLATQFRVAQIPGYLARGDESLEQQYGGIPGVTDVSLAFRGTGGFGSTFGLSSFQVLAVDSTGFGEISWYRGDFSPRSLSSLMGTLRPGEGTEPVAIPEDATSIGVWIKPRDFYPIMSLWLVVSDAAGETSIVTLGNTGPPRWHLLTADLPDDLTRPLTLTSVQIFEPVIGSTGSPGTITLDDIHVRTGRDGEARVIEDFEGEVGWTPLATSILAPDSVAPSKEDAFRGDAALEFTFGRDTSRGIRGFYRGSSGGPLPVLASPSFVETNGTGVGVPFVVEIMGWLVPVVVTETVDYFPTMDPSDGGFIVADLVSMLGYLNVVSNTATILPNELFLTHSPDAYEGVQVGVNGLVTPADPVLVFDLESELESLRLDPLVTAGWKGMALLSLGIVVFTAGLGYVVYLVSFADRARGEMGFLRSLGLSRRQMIGLLALENLAIAAIGVGLGTWAGFQMSRLLVSSVTVTETGGVVVPPLILTTDWAFMVPIYLALVAIFMIAVLRLGRNMADPDLVSISRVEG